MSQPDQPEANSPNKTELKPAGLLKSSSLVGSMTMLSRVLGLVRDIIFARVIGAGPLADAFFVAFKIPNFFRRLFAEGAFSQAFVPVLAEVKATGDLQAVKQLINKVAGNLTVSLFGLTLFAVIFAPFFTAIFAFNWWYDDELAKFNAASDMLRITFPYLMLISLTGLAGAVLNSYDRFAVPAITPVFLNISLIGAALIAGPWFEEPAFALAWGVLLAGVVQLLFQLPFLARIHLLPVPSPDWRDSQVRKILALMAPAIFGVSVSQINLLLDTLLATFLPTGSVSWLYYSDRLSELPLGVFGVAAATVILPNLSRHHAAKSDDAFSQTLAWAMRFILLIAVPAAIGLMVMAEPILTALFFYGDVIESRDIAMATLSLRAYALGLIAFMLVKVLAPGYYARQDMKTPVRIGVIAMASNMVLNLIFVLPLHHYWQIGHVGLALATSASAFLNVYLLFRGLRQRNIYHHEPGWGRFIAMLVLANGLLVALLLWWNAYLPDWSAFAWYTRAGWLAAIMGSALLVYLIGLRLGGFNWKFLKEPTNA